MLQAQWFALAGMSMLLTLVWLVVQPDENVFVTGSLSFAGWALSTVTAPGIEVITQSGETVAAGSSTLAFVALAWAILSALATIGYRTGHYPPDPAEEETIAP